MPTGHVADYSNLVLDTMVLDMTALVDSMLVFWQAFFVFCCWVCRCRKCLQNCSAHSNYRICMQCNTMILYICPQ